MKKTKDIINVLGGAGAVAELCEITSQAVSQWQVIPINQAIKIEEKTNGAVSREEMRPDIFSSKKRAKL